MYCVSGGVGDILSKLRDIILMYRNRWQWDGFGSVCLHDKKKVHGGH